MTTYNAAVIGLGRMGSTDAPALACDGDHVQCPVYIVDKEIRLCAVAIYPLVERCSQVPESVQNPGASLRRGWGPRRDSNPRHAA